MMVFTISFCKKGVLSMSRQGPGFLFSHSDGYLSHYCDFSFAVALNVPINRIAVCKGSPQLSLPGMPSSSDSL